MPAGHHEHFERRAAGEGSGDAQTSVGEQTTVPLAHEPEGTLSFSTAATLRDAPVSSRDFGDYELLERLGKGGMGIVFKARQKSLNRVVALKMIRTGEFAGDDEVLRLKAEAEAAGQLDHPNIVPVYEVGLCQGQHFFSMGYVDGPTLAHRVSDGPLPPPEAADIVRTLADAVQYAHQQGVIHRDLKPQNVLLSTRTDRLSGSGSSNTTYATSGFSSNLTSLVPRITDFGLARRAYVENSLTETGQILGTPNYMPPEQAAGLGRHVSASADIYALGAILYCLLTGRPPYQGSNPIETIRQVLEQEPVAPTKLVGTIPLDLETIVLKCLQKDPRRRYPSAAELSDDLGRFLRREPILARPIGRLERIVRWSARNQTVASLIALAAVLLVVGLVFTSWFAWEAHIQRTDALSNLSTANENARRWKEQEKLANTNASRAQQLAQNLQESLIATSVSAALAKKNQYFADVNLAQQVLMAGDVSQAIALLSNHLPREGETDLRGFEWYYLWSLTHSTAFAIPWSGSPSWAASNDVRAVASSPDGSILAVAGGRPDKGELILYDSVSRRELRRCLGQRPIYTALAWSPDGSRLYSASGNVNEPGQVDVWDPTTGESLINVKFDDPVTSLAISHDGMQLAVGTAKLQTGRGSPPDRFFNVPTAGRAGGVKLISTRDGALSAEMPGMTGHIFSVAISHGGDLIAAGNEKGEVFLWNKADTTQVSHFSLGLRYAWALAFSPKDDLLAAAGGFWDEPGEVFLWNIETRAITRRLRGHHGGVTALEFTPTGESLATGSFDRTARLWDAARGEQTAVFYGLKTFAGDLCFNRDAEVLMAGGWSGSSSATGGGEILGWNVRAGRNFASVDLLPEPYVQEAWAGDTVVIVGNKCIEIWNAHTAVKERELRTLSGPRTVDVTFDGRLVAAGGFMPTSYIWNAATGDLVAELATGTVPFVAFSPDGKTLATSGDDGVVRLWEAGSGEPLHALTGHTDVVWMCDFTPDSKRLASASWDGTVRLWDVETGRALGQFPGHTEALWRVNFLEEGRILLSRSGSQRDQIGIFDITSAARKGRSSSLPQASSREFVLISAYAQLGLARERAGQLDKADAAYSVMLERLERHLDRIPAIDGFIEREVSMLEYPLDLLIRSHRWQEAERMGQQLLTIVESHKPDTSQVADFQYLNATLLYALARVSAGKELQQDFITRSRRARELLLQVAAASKNADFVVKKLAECENAFAWQIATRNASPEEIQEALMSARDAVDRRGEIGSYWNTLGTILVRAEQWEEAVKALQKSCDLTSGGNEYDWYPMAIALGKVGKQGEAREVFARAERAVKSKDYLEADLIFLREAAAATLAP